MESIESVGWEQLGQLVAWLVAHFPENESDVAYVERTRKALTQLADVVAPGAVMATVRRPDDKLQLLVLAKSWSQEQKLCYRRMLKALAHVHGWKNPDEA